MKNGLTLNLPAVANIGWVRLAFFCLAFAALSIASPYAIYQELGRQPLFFDGRLFSWPVLGGGVALLVVYFASDGLRLHYTLKALGQKSPKRHLGKLVFINILFSNITPMGTGGGFAQIWYLRRRGVRLGSATAATTLRTLLAVALIFIPTPFLALFLDPVPDSFLGERLGLYLGLFAFAYTGFFAVVLMRMRWVMGSADTFLGLLHRLRLIGADRLRRWRFAARREMICFSRAVRGYLSGPKTDIALSVLFTALFLLALFSFPALLLWGLDYQVDYLLTLGLLVITTFIMYFSPTPGAAGIAEGVFGLFFSGLVHPAHLVLVVVAWRFLTIHLGMLIGVPVTLHAITGSDSPRV